MCSIEEYTDRLVRAIVALDNLGPSNQIAVHAAAEFRADLAAAKSVDGIEPTIEIYVPQQ